MFRTCLVIALSSLAPVGVAHAMDADLKAQKSEVKEAKQYSKDIDRLVKKWEDAAEKDRAERLAELDAELLVVTRTELGRLRDLGVKTQVKAPEPRYADQPDKILPIAPESPKMETLRDQLVELRDLQAKFDEGNAHNKDFNRKSDLLEALQTNVEDRYLRKDARFDEAKAAS